MSRPVVFKMCGIWVLTCDDHVPERRLSRWFSVADWRDPWSVAMFNALDHYAIFHAAVTDLSTE